MIEQLEPTAVLGLLERLRGQLAGAGRLVISSTNLAAFVRVASLAFGHGEVMAPPRRANLRGRLLYADQVIAPALVPHMATSWVCSTMLAVDV